MMNVWLMTLGVLAALCLVPSWKVAVWGFERALTLGSLIVTVLGCYAFAVSLILSAYFISSAF